jgi:hypothetical protein
MLAINANIVNRMAADMVVGMFRIMWWRTKSLIIVFSFFNFWRIMLLFMFCNTIPSKGFNSSRLEKADHFPAKTRPPFSTGSAANR